MMVACSRTLTWGACRWSIPTVGGTRGIMARAAIMANCSGVTAITSSGSRVANCGSRPARRGVSRPAVTIRSRKVSAICL